MCLLPVFFWQFISCRLYLSTHLSGHMVLIDADKSRMSKENRTLGVLHEICFPLCVQPRHSIAAYNLVHTVDRRNRGKTKKKEVNASALHVSRTLPDGAHRYIPCKQCSWHDSYSPPPCDDRPPLQPDTPVFRNNDSSF